MALVAAGPLIVLATLLHPSRETAGTIVASEPRLVAAHVVYTLAWLLVLLGLPGLYAARRGGWDGWDCRASGLLSPALISSQ
jgi:hypothetical protein